MTAVVVALALGTSLGARRATPTVPHVSSLTPSSAVGARLAATIAGTGFDGASAVEVSAPDGTLAGTGTVTLRSATRIVATLPLAGAAPGRYAVRVVNEGGASSEAATLTLVSEVSVSPTSGPPGTVFTYTGRGFKGRFSVISHLQGPDGLEWQAKRFATGAEGTFAHDITSAEFVPGTYTAWALDDYTKVASNRATFEVTGRTGTE